MKSFIVGVFLILGAGIACADEMADAAKALSVKDYPRAFATYTRLANAGNPEAALQLGEMYWYGEGAPLDRAKGDALFARAAAAGSQAAVSATRLTQQRQQRLADIAYWTTGYNGADLVAKLNCATPVFPPYSATKGDIAEVSAAYDAYTACYNGFIGNLENAMPPAKRIPEDVALLMSEQELGQAREHVGKVFADVAARGALAAGQAAARRGEWMAQTTAYVTTWSKRQQMYMAEIERQNREVSVRRDWTHNAGPGRAITTTTK